ncbi:TIGR02206 family membrane protein [Mycoplasmatota bacterium WC44]
MDYFSNKVIRPFYHFMPEHIIMLTLLPLAILITYIFRKSLGTFEGEKYIRYTLAIIMLTLEILLYVWKIHNGIWTWYNGLPLALCGFTLYLMSYALFTKSYKVFGIASFWAMGALGSSIDPSIKHGITNFRFTQYMISHELIVYSVFYMAFVHNFVPNKKSIKDSIFYITLLAIFFIILNQTFNQNFMFLNNSENTILEIFEFKNQLVYTISLVISGYLAMIFAYFMINFIYKKTIN